RLPSQYRNTPPDVMVADWANADGAARTKKRKDTNVVESRRRRAHAIKGVLQCRYSLRAASDARKMPRLLLRSTVRVRTGLSEAVVRGLQQRASRVCFDSTRCRHWDLARRRSKAKTPDAR